MKPTPHSRDEYVKWHEATVAGDSPLLDRLERLRDDMAARAQPDLEFLHQLLTYMFTYTRNEYKHSRGQEVTYQTPLPEALRTDPSGTPSPRYDFLFKPVPSIVSYCPE